MILTILKLVIAYLLPWVFGYQVLTLLDRQKVLGQGFKLFAAFPVGMGIFTLESFVVGILGARLTLGTFILILLFDAIVLGVFIYWRRSQPHPNPLPSGRGERGEVTSSKNKWLVYLILSLLVIKVSASIWQVSHIPTYEFDAWNNWNLRAKVIYTEQQISLDKNNPFYLGGGIKSYPLNDGLFKVWVANMIGEWDEQAVNLGSVVYYVVLLGFFYFALPEKWGRLGRWGATYLLASLPFLYFYSWIPYADLEFAVYLFLTVVAFFKFLQSTPSSSPLYQGGEREGVWLYLSALALALAIWTKNEGFAVVLPVLLVIVTISSIAKKLTMRDLLSYWLVVLAVASPWLIFRFVNKLDVLSGDSSTFNLVFNREFLVEAWHSIFLRSHFNFLWLLVFLLIIFKAKKICQDLPLRFLASSLVVLFLFYNGIIIFTDKALDLSALVRVNLQIAPLALYLAVLLIKQEVLDKLR